MRICILGSGSAGNSAIVEAGGKWFMIDCGLSMSELEKRLREIHISPIKIGCVILTHGHSDHIRGLKFAQRYNIPIFGNKNTLEAAKEYTSPSLFAEITEGVFPLPGNEAVKVKAFIVAHDFDPTFGFVFREGDKILTFITDIGTDSQGVSEAVAMSTAVVLESNYDPVLLARGKYPPYLKKRIVSGGGHLSNYLAGEILRESKAKLIILAHLSEENNTPELALETVRGISGHDGNVFASNQHKPTQIFLI